MAFKIGDRLVKLDENYSFIVSGFTKGWKYVPDGWPMANPVSAHNPRYYRLYEGATSVFIREDNSSDV